MKYYLIAGEASGDLHGSNLMLELKKADPEAQFRFVGGDLMEKAGGERIKHYREMAFMGFLNVILHLKTIRQTLELCKKDLLRFNPDVLILIDYPGFNLRIAEFAHKYGLKVFYYISPKIWAWKEYRIKKIKAFVDEMFTILPFETEFYRKHGMEVHYTGNPLLDAVQNFQDQPLPEKQFRVKNHLDERPLIALLAGSRKQEIQKNLPVLRRVVPGFSGFQFVLAGVSQLNREVYERLLKEAPVRLIFDQTYELLHHSYAAVVASGTASLETALFEVPQTVIYKVEGGLLTDAVMRHWILKTPWVSLPNIIMKKEVVREFIQKEMKAQRIKKELEKLLFNNRYREKITKDYKRLKEKMGEAGCSKRAAEKMVTLLLTAEKENN